MGCRCNERGKLIGQAGRALAQGQVRRAAQRVQLAVRSGAGDAAEAARRAQAAARMRQMPRR